MKNVLTMSAALVILVAIHTTVDASIKAGDTIRFLNGPGNDAGEFIAQKKVGSTWEGDSRVFCVERNEYVKYAAEYTVHSVINAAVMGGQGGHDTTIDGLSGDTLSGQAAWLYYEFVKGTLEGYDYADTTVEGRPGSADKLQHAFWRLEGESHNAEKSEYYYDLVTKNPPTQAAMDFALTKVRVINPIYVSADGLVTHKQSQLYAPMPEPATFIVWSLLGLTCAGGTWWKRRRS